MGESLVTRLKLDAAREDALFVMRIDARPEFLKLSYKNLVIEDVERSLGLRDWDFRLATRHHSEPAVPRILQPVRRHRTKSRSHHHGHANIGVAGHFCAVKSGRRDADDANRMVIQDRRRIASASSHNSGRQRDARPVCGRPQAQSGGQETAARPVFQNNFRKPSRLRHVRFVRRNLH